MSDSLPSSAAIDLNAQQLADYAAISQVGFLLGLPWPRLHGLQQFMPTALDLAVLEQLLCQYCIDNR